MTSRSKKQVAWARDTTVTHVLVMLATTGVRGRVRPWDVDARVRKIRIHYEENKEELGATEIDVEQLCTAVVYRRAMELNRDKEVRFFAGMVKIEDLVKFVSRHPVFKPLHLRDIDPRGVAMMGVEDPKDLREGQTWLPKFWEEDRIL